MSGNGSGPLKYYCMSCGTEHKEIVCPKCGSKKELAKCTTESRLYIYYIEWLHNDHYSNFFPNRYMKIY